MADKRDYYEVLGVEKGASEEEIKKAVDEAAQFAAEDKKNKEQAETFNQADQLIYQTEKTMKEMNDKLDPADKATLENELESFKKVREGNNVEEIKSAMETLTQKSYEIFGKVYQQQNPQGGAQGGPDGGAGFNGGAGFGGQGGANDDGTVESNFTDNN